MRVPSLLGILLLTACGHIIPGDLTGDGKPFDFATEHPCAAVPEDREKVEIRYLGTASVYLRWRGEAILLGASFSNPGLVRAGLWRAKFDEERVDAALTGIDRTSIKAILAGHSHYDHIGDVPVLAENKPIEVWVNESGIKMLNAYPGVNAKTIDPAKTITISDSIHVRAVPSDHAPQLCRWRRFPCVYAPGEVRDPWTAAWPRHLLRSFRGGRTYAFVIELRDAGRPVYRIYYNDSSAASPHGQVVDDFDLAILTMAQWNWVRDYPRDLLLTLRPRHVIVSHWDNFFRKDLKASKFAPNLSNASAARFLRIVNEHVEGAGGPVNADLCGVTSSDWTMPVVGATMHFKPGRRDAN